MCGGLAGELAGRLDNRCVGRLEPAVTLAQRVEAAAFAPPLRTGAESAAVVDAARRHVANSRRMRIYVNVLKHFAGSGRSQGRRKDNQRNEDDHPGRQAVPKGARATESGASVTHKL